MRNGLKSVRLEEIWLKAQKHRQASVIGIPSDTRGFELCECCGQAVQKEPIPICEHTKQFQRYGFGYPLWFSFLKCCIFLILVLIASKTANGLSIAASENWNFCYGYIQVNNSFSQTKGIQNNPIYIDSSNSVIIQHTNKTITELSSTDSDQPKCTSFMVFLSTFKGDSKQNNYFLKTIQFAIHLIALVAIRNKILKQEQYYDQRTILISKYSIIIHNLPNVINLKRKVKQFFLHEFNCSYGNEDSQIQQFIYIFKEEPLSKLNQQKQKLQEEIIKIQAESNNSEDDSMEETKLREKLSQLEIQLEEKITQTRQMMNNDSVKCNKMIVVMRTEGDKASVLYSYKQAVKQGKTLNQYFYDPEETIGEVSSKSTKVFIKQAPQPNEIIWQHLDEPDQQRKLLILQGYLFTFLFLIIVTIVFYFILLAKNKLFLSALTMQESDPTNIKVVIFKIFATIIVFVALFGVVLFNKFILGNVIHKFVHMQHHAYTDKENHSFALKYALGMFFTTALMTIAVEALTYDNFYTHPYGVIQIETLMFFVSAFFIPFIWWINPYNIVKNIKRKIKHGSLMTQKQANQLVQQYPYVLGKRYAEIFQIMWFTFLYSDLLPLGSFLMLVGLVLYYWVDKYNFLRKSAINTRVSGKMAILGLKSLDATLFLCPAGELLFTGIIHNQFNLSSLIFIIIGLIYTCLPITNFIWKLNGEKFLIEQNTYDESEMRFKETYFSLHPVYKLTHKNQIEKHREIVNEFYQQDLKKVKHFGTGRGNYKRETSLSTKRTIS